jgi:hypothetical protein
MSTTITTTADIPAPPEAVWGVLTDFAAYWEWNPFMDRVEGTPQVGSKLRVHMVRPGGRGVTFRPTVLAAVPGRELRWLGTLGVRGLFDGEHSFTLTADGNGGTRLTHDETFSGVLVTIMRGSVSGAEAGFQAFNRALTQRVQALTPDA